MSTEYTTLDLQIILAPRGPTPAKILYEISKSQKFWQDFGFLAFHF